MIPSVRTRVVVGAFAVCAVAAGCATFALRPSPPSGDVVDGFVIGAPRAVSGAEFHRLETTAKAISKSAWPEQRAVSFSLYGAGTLPDGTIQRETEGPFRFLMLIGLVGGERHAIVIECDEATFPDFDSCAPASGGS
jgi:hypothetical protein